LISLDAKHLSVVFITVGVRSLDLKVQHIRGTFRFTVHIK